MNPFTNRTGIKLNNLISDLNKQIQRLKEDLEKEKNSVRRLQEERERFKRKIRSLEEDIKNDTYIKELEKEFEEM